MEEKKLSLVLLESRFAGERERNIKYARLCMADCFTRNEAPFASHLLYTQDHVLDDDIKTERDLGIEAGLLWGEHAEKTVVYEDFGYSEGMKRGIEAAEKTGRLVEYRKLPINVFKKHFSK